jgi:hypothetical protein
MTTLRQRLADTERGSVSVWLATAAVVMIILVGVVVDLAGQVHAQQHTRNVANQAARVAGQQINAPVAIRGQGVQANAPAGRRGRPDLPQRLRRHRDRLHRQRQHHQGHNLLDLQHQVPLDHRTGQHARHRPGRSTHRPRRGRCVPVITLRRRLLGLAALLAILGIIIGLPTVLLAVGANPFAGGLPTFEAIKTALTSPDDGTLAVALIKIVAWASWGFLTLSILLEVLARLRGVRAPRLPGLRLPQNAARGLVGTAMMLFVAIPTAGIANAAAAGAATSSVTATVVSAAPAEAATQTQTHRPRRQDAGDPRPGHGQAHRQARRDPVVDRRRPSGRWAPLQGDRRAQPQHPRRPAGLHQGRLGPRRARAPAPTTETAPSSSRRATPSPVSRSSSTATPPATPRSSRRRAPSPSPGEPSSPTPT